MLQTALKNLAKFCPKSSDSKRRPVTSQWVDADDDANHYDADDDDKKEAIKLK